MLIQERLNNFIASKFVREVSALLTSKGVSLAAGFVGTLVFPNLLGIEQYGIYAIILSLIGIISSLINFGVTPTTVSLLSEAAGRGDRTEVRNLVIYFLKVSLLLNNAFWLLFLIFAQPFIQVLYGTVTLTGYFRIMIIVNLLAVPWPLLTIVYQVFRKINTLSILETLKKLVYVVLGIMLVVWGFGVVGIFYSLLITEVMFFLYSIVRLSKLHLHIPLFPKLSEVTDYFNQVKLTTYLKFTSLVAVDKNLNNIVETLPGFLVGILATPHDAGLFRLAHSIGTLPKMFASTISRMLSSILPYKEAAQAGSIKPYYHRVAKYGTLFTLATIAAVATGTTLLFKVFYKPELWPAQNVVYIVLLSNLFMGYAVSFAPIVRTLKKMAASIYINLFALITAIIIGYLTIPHYGATGGALAMSGWFIASIILIVKIDGWIKKSG